MIGGSADALAQAKKKTSNPEPFAEVETGPKWGAHIDIEGKWGNRRSLGDIGLFAPLWQNQTSLLFTDIRGRYDNDDGREGNFGIGFRQMLMNGWNAGAYAYYDARRTPAGNLFQQATLGGELLHADYDLRANFYLPFAKREYTLGGAGGGTPFVDFSGGNIQIVTPGGQLVERSLRGADVEAGWRVPVFPLDSKVQFRAYAGAFWFDGENLMKDIAGPRGRLELSWDDLPALNTGSRFTLGLESQRDDVRGTNNFFTARLRIPLAPVKTASARLNAQERRMTERIVRDVDIVAGTAQKGSGVTQTENAINDINNIQVTSVTQVNDAANVQTAIDAATTGGVIIVNGILDTTTHGTTNLASGQTLIGGGTVLPLRGATSGVTINYVVPGAAGGLTATVNNNSLLEMASFSVVKGMSLSNQTTTSGASVSAWNNADSSHIINNTITGLAGANTSTGIWVTNSMYVTVRGNTITNADRGIATVTATGTSVQDNTISARRRGINAQLGEDEVFSGNTIQANGVAGIVADNSTNVTISNNTFGPVLVGNVLEATSSTFNAASTGNIDNSSPAATRCSVVTSTGTVGFTTGPNC